MTWRRYDRARALAYDAERDAADDQVDATRHVLVSELGGAPHGPVMDIGAGTGLWSERIARWTSAPVVALEPSDAMLSVIADKRSPGVLPVQGRGEALPVGDGACGAAWLSTVVHHFDDLAAAAAEIARVLAPDGTALVRSMFPDQPSGQLHVLRFFPSAARVAAQFPGMDEVVGVFQRAGLGLRRRHAPREVASRTRRAFLERVRSRGDSLLREVADAEFASGLGEARRWADESPDAAVHFRPDMLVFRRPRR
ncbi:MAG TPA: class I SAM-dependent methyltransferase [Egibacteraceae bacterium]|nr:class I SAM-dependent methyltransferase [Egibacteraceae bacterium]